MLSFSENITNQPKQNTVIPGSMKLFGSATKVTKHLMGKFLTIKGNFCKFYLHSHAVNKKILQLQNMYIQSNNKNRHSYIGESIRKRTATRLLINQNGRNVTLPTVTIVPVLHL